ncbi:MAG TPA: HEAT repeat domain-containing protein [Planctomycetota bacterium]|nr:HEAT repeat domain-containing protein [Planctomycetota bacterium]
MRNPLGVCLALACLVLGCGKEEAPEDVRRVEAVLRTGAGDNKRAIREFVKEEGLTGLERLLASDSANVRMLALSGLGYLEGDAKATQLLLKFVHGEDSQDAYWAIIALGYQGAPEVKEAIQKVLQSQDPHRRAGACIAIKECGDESLYPLLDVALRDEDPGVRLTAEKMKLFIAEGQAVTDDRPVEPGNPAPDK